MFSTKSFNLVKIALKIIIIVFIIDIFINLLIPENIKKKIGTTRNYSLKSEKFHHQIAPNINLYEHWGSKKYKVKTNQYAMRISEEESNVLVRNKNNIGFMGDSFVYGSGINYKKHFLNIIKKKNNKFNLLNLGYVSYSPSIYFKRIKFYIEHHNINFVKIFLFIDASDVQDEGIFYREDKNGNIVRAWLSDNENYKRNKKFIIKNYLQQNSFIFKIYQILSAPTISEKNIACLKNKKKIKNFKKYLNNERFGYGFDHKAQKLNWVKKGQKKIIKYLNQIKDIALKNNIDLILVYYPSAIEILNEQVLSESFHYKFLKKWSLENDIKFINSSIDFQKSKNGMINYKNNFILCDVHWNNHGHKLIAKKILKELNEKN